MPFSVKPPLGSGHVTGNICAVGSLSLMAWRHAMLVRQRFIAGTMFILLGVALIGAARAQQGDGGGPRPMMMLERTRAALQQLDLSPDQKTKVMAALDQARDQMAELRGQLKDMDPQDRIQHVRAVLQEARSKIEAELTADQKAKLEEKLSEARAAAGGNGAGGGLGRAGMLDQLRKTLDAMNLTDDQRMKVNALLDETRAKLRDLAGEQDADARRGKFSQTLQDMREQLAQILTPEQRQSLRQSMQAGFGGGGGPQPLDRRPRNVPAPPSSDKPATLPAAGGQMMMDEMQSTSKASKPTAAPIDPAAAGPAKPIDTGQTAPDFKLQKIEGATVQLSSLKGRVVVLIFGSYSSPSFRGRAASIDRLTREIATTASVFVVYTKEAHPVGGWEVDRNKDENIAIKQPATLDARRDIARKTREALRLTTPLLVDDMENSVTTAYGGFPNGAVVINRDGIVAGSQQWVETGALKHIVEEASAKVPPK
jgi:peroxiredoxin/Spy/CpxP family protein refolding chaperone